MRAKLAMCAVGVGVITFTAVSSVSASRDATLQLERRRTLDVLREHLARIDQHAVELRRGDRSREALLEQDLDHLRTAREQLALREGEEDFDVVANTDAQMARVSRYVDADLSLQKAQDTFSAGMAVALDDDTLTDAMHDALVHLKATTLAYQLGDADEAPQVSALLHRLRSLGVETHPSSAATLAAADQILSQRSGTDALLELSVEYVGADEAIEQFARHVEAEERRGDVTALIERSIAFGLAGVFLILAVFAFRRLSQQKLELERRVEERTREIASRNRQLEESLAALRQTQEKLVAADRMATLGTMAAGVAHEINNPAAYILANATFIKDEFERGREVWKEGEGGELDLAPADDIVGAAGSIEHGVERVAQIVRDLKAFSRQSDDELQSVDLKDVLELSLRMAGTTIPKRIEVKTQFEPGLGCVKGNAGRLGQVFLNLFTNAAHAMKSGGEPMLKVTAKRDGGELQVDVVDNGSGMSPEVLSRIFDPFFTTKPVGEGTGLGLSICHGIIEHHNGTITATSKPGKGTTFTVRLPRTDAKAAEVTGAHKAASAVRLKILAIDDDASVGEALRRSLSREHDVECTVSAEKGLELVMAGREFDLVLCDLTMPGMTGADFFERLQVVAPEQAKRVLFFSGGATNERVKRFAEGLADRLMLKPININVLRQRLATFKPAAAGASA